MGTAPPAGLCSPVITSHLPSSQPFWEDFWAFAWFFLSFHNQPIISIQAPNYLSNLSSALLPP